MLWGFGPTLSNLITNTFILTTMKNIIIIALFLASSFTATAGKPSDRHFYVTFTYIGANGLLKVGETGISCAAGYPKKADLLLKAGKAAGKYCKCIQITGVAAISKSDYDGFFTNHK